MKNTKADAADAAVDVTNMRLFIGIGEFDGDFREELLANMEDLANESSSGRFTDEDNLHITLAFLGEINRNDLSYIREAMIRSVADFEPEPLELTLGEFGSFKMKKGKGRHYWRGIEDNERLFTLQKNLEREIRYQGFYLEDRKFKAHITLARNCVLYDDFDKEWFDEGLYYEKIKAKHLILFESTSLGGKSVYTPIYRLSI